MAGRFCILNQSPIAIGLLQRQSDMDLILEIAGLTRQQIQQINDRPAAGEILEAIVNS